MLIKSISGFKQSPRTGNEITLPAKSMASSKKVLLYQISISEHPPRKNSMMPNFSRSSDIPIWCSNLGEAILVDGSVNTKSLIPCTERVVEPRGTF